MGKSYNAFLFGIENTIKWNETKFDGESFWQKCVEKGKQAILLASLTVIYAKHIPLNRYNT